MGYYTDYRAEIVEGDKNAILQAVASEHFASCFEYEVNWKWYDHEADLRELTKRFPDALIVLKGNGEEEGDLWVKYFRNGKKQTCSAEITYPPFDEAMLR